MTTLNEMKEVIKAQLQSNGTLDKVRSQLRSEFFQLLNNNAKSSHNLSNQDLIMYELIREFLNYNNMNHTSSVMTPEAGLPEQPLDRGIIASQLNVQESSETRQLPLLYSKFDGLMPQVWYSGSIVVCRSILTSSRSK